jgi:hypothetical protein
MESLFSKDKDLSEVCNNAFRFRSSFWMTVVSQKAKKETEPSFWKNIRHQIGRLGAWIKASNIIVDYYKQVPAIVRGFKFERLSNPKRRINPGFLQNLSMKEALDAAVPKYEVTELEKKLQKLQKDEKRTAADMFEKRMESKNRLRVHAEVTLLETFLSNDYDFWGPSKYIGCSKNSCYCCQLYIQHRSNDTIHRPSHGNVYRQWAAPELSDLPNDSLGNQLMTINHISKSIRQDLKAKLLRGDAFRRRKQDSTTGISSNDHKLLAVQS